MISIDVGKEPDSEWNKRLLDSKLGTIYQTKEYGAYVESQLKSKPIYLKFYTNNGEIVSQLLLFQSFKGRGKLAEFFGRGFVYSAVAKASALLPKYTNWIFGPVIFNTTYNSEISESLGNLLISWKGQFSGSTHPLNNDFNFDKKFNFQKNESGTFIIDLKQDLQKILDNADKNSVKKNIKRAQERGVTISEISSNEDLLTYHRLLFTHRKENDLLPYSVDDIVNGFNVMKSVGQKGFLAWHDKIPVGGIFISSFNNYINEWGIARSKIDTEKKLYSLDLLRWNIITWGKENHCNYYDLSGVKLSRITPKDESLFRNKEKWRGNLVIYPVFST